MYIEKQSNMKIYHGTNSIFSKFRLPKEAENHEYYGEAIYFSTDYDTAKYYGDRVIEMEIFDDIIDITIDAEGKGIKQLSHIVTGLIKKGGVIAIKNIADYNMQGAQCRYFDFDETDFGEYKYHVDYRVYLSSLKKSEANRMMNVIRSLGIHADMSKSVVTGKYTIYVNEPISDDKALALNNAGIHVTRCMQKASPRGTIVIFAGEDALGILNSKL